MATYAEVIYCKNCKYCYKYYQGEYSKGGYQFTCEKDLKKVGPFDFCSWADYKESKLESKPLYPLGAKMDEVEE